jgi:hypothetical protein
MPRPNGIPTPYGRVPHLSSKTSRRGIHATWSLDGAASSMAPPVQTAVARPAHELDIGAALAAEANVGPVVHGDRRGPAAMQHQATAAAGAPAVARHEPPPAPRPPDRGAEIQLLEQGMPPGAVHAAGSSDGTPLTHRAEEAPRRAHRADPENPMAPAIWATQHNTSACPKWFASRRSRVRIPLAPLSKMPASRPVLVSVQSSGPVAGIPCWCSESCRYGPRRGGGGL